MQSGAVSQIQLLGAATYATSSVPVRGDSPTSSRRRRSARTTHASKRLTTATMRTIAINKSIIA